MSTKLQTVSDVGPGEGRLSRKDVRSLLGVVRAATRITSQTTAALRGSGVSLRGTDFDALVFLVSEGPMRPAELLRHTVLTDHPATLHGILERLDEAGLVSRSASPEHSRGVVYSATPAGQAAIEAVWATVEREVVHRFAGHFGDDELDQLRDLTARI